MTGKECANEDKTNYAFGYRIICCRCSYLLLPAFNGSIQRAFSPRIIGAQTGERAAKYFRPPGH